VPQIVANKRQLAVIASDFLLSMALANVIISTTFLAKSELSSSMIWSVALISGLLFYHLFCLLLFQRTLGAFAGGYKSKLSRLASLGQPFNWHDTGLRKINPLYPVYALLVISFITCSLTFILPSINSSKTLSETTLELPQEPAILSSVMFSKRLYLKGEVTDHLDNLWLIFPGFKLTKKSGRNSVTTYLRLRSLNGELSAGYHRLHQVNWKLFKKSFTVDNYIELKECLKQGEFTFGWTRACERLKIQLLKLMQMPQAESFFLTSLYGKQHLFLLSKRSLASDLKFVRWINLESDMPYVFELSWRGAGDELYRTLLKTIHRYFSPALTQTSDPKQIHVFEMMDLMMSKNVSIGTKERFEEAILAFYTGRVSKSLKVDSPVKITLIQEELRLINRMISLKKKDWNPIFSIRWESMMNAAMREDRKYFKVKD
jgi:hypothetical protein